MIDALHPARSAEFLSRLHDGELTRAEIENFEAHRAACPDCRAAVHDYEATLAAYRSAASDPPPSDLSARILRKIRAQSPSRRPFGVHFGIDVRWAGLFVAALIVVLLSAPLLLRRDASSIATAPRDAISARLVTRESEPGHAAPGSGAAPKAPEAARKVARDRPAPPADAAADRPAASAPAPAAPPPESAASAESPRLEAQASVRTLRRATASAERGDETGGAGSGELKDFDRTLRLSVRAADAEGATPAVLSTPADERLTPLRGRAFVLMVESGGRVLDVKPAPSSERPASREKRREAAPRRAPDPADALREIRFHAGDRPRRLLVRIE